MGPTLPSGSAHQAPKPGFPGLFKRLLTSWVARSSTGCAGCLLSPSCRGTVVRCGFCFLVHSWFHLLGLRARSSPSFSARFLRATERDRGCPQGHPASKAVALPRATGTASDCPPAEHVELQKSASCHRGVLRAFWNIEEHVFRSLLHPCSKFFENWERS